jgi:hypothetical protein
MKPRKLTSRRDREMGRRIRNFHWKFMERLQREGTIHVCVWNKYGLEERQNELMLDMVSGCELLEWMSDHRDWFIIGKQDEARWTNPIALTEVGKLALSERKKYDMEPVKGGLFEPGFEVIPIEEAILMEEKKNVAN